MKKPICKCVRAHREPFSRSFGTNETQQLREGQLVGRMLQRLATGVKQAKGPTHGAARHSTRMRSIFTQPVVLGTCCSMHGVMNSAEGFALYCFY